MKTFWRNNSLSIVLLSCFLLFWFGQSLAGHAVNNQELQEHGKSAESYLEYLSSGHFWQATFENWESEFLQMAAYVFLTCFLFQKGSSESKDPDKKESVDEDPQEHQDDENAPGPVKKGGWQLALYKNSLGLAMLIFFALSFTGHALGGLKEYNEEQQMRGGDAVSLSEFISTSQFWFESLQNWQSEFLAVFAIVILSIWLRQHGSPESKPVHAPHDQTGND
ncbi:MAG TPA: DUF6766 family protein [Abditibacteriaceae bacterium]|jgi:hypothetical protein